MPAAAGSSRAGPRDHRLGGWPAPLARTALKRNRPLSVDVTVHNSGSAPEAYFADARLSTSAQHDLASLGGSGTTFPLKVNANVPVYVVPTDTTSLSALAQTTGSENIQFDWGTLTGDPDLASSVGTSAAGSYTSSDVTQAPWYIAPTTVGPFGAGGAAPADVNTAMLAFDPAVSSPLGDLRQSALDPTVSVGAVIDKPGHSATIPVTITPSGPRGAVVSGTLFVDDESLVSFGSLVPDGNQVAAPPYTYRIG